MTRWRKSYACHQSDCVLSMLRVRSPQFRFVIIAWHRRAAFELRGACICDRPLVSVLPKSAPSRAQCVIIFVYFVFLPVDITLIQHVQYLLWAHRVSEKKKKSRARMYPERFQKQHFLVPLLVSVGKAPEAKLWHMQGMDSAHKHRELWTQAVYTVHTSTIWPCCSRACSTQNIKLSRTPAQTTLPVILLHSLPIEKVFQCKFPFQVCSKLPHAAFSFGQELVERHFGDIVFRRSLRHWKWLPGPAKYERTNDVNYSPLRHGKYTNAEYWNTHTIRAVFAWYHFILEHKHQHKEHSQRRVSIQSERYSS